MPRGYKSDGTKLGFQKGNKSAEGVRKFGEANGMFGRKHPEATKILIGLKSKGRNLESKSPNWKGDNVGYVALHDWVRSRLGKPTTCEVCGKTNLTGINIQWANKSGLYKRNLKDWLRLCKPCHVEFDDTINRGWKTRKENKKC
jgi:hypothetical protein